MDESVLLVSDECREWKVRKVQRAIIILMDLSMEERVTKQDSAIV